MSDRIVADKLIQHIKANNETLSALNHYMDKELHLKPDIRAQVISLIVIFDDKPEPDYKKIVELIIKSSR
jgi:hypothetical protein